MKIIDVIVSPAGGSITWHPAKLIKEKFRKTRAACTPQYHQNRFIKIVSF